MSEQKSRRYKLKNEIPLVCVKDGSGRINDHYHSGGGGRTPRFGPIIDYPIDDEQAARLMRVGLIERIEGTPDV